MPAGINSRLDAAEEKTGDLEDTVRQFTQNENGTNNFFLMKDYQFSERQHPVA